MLIEREIEAKLIQHMGETLDGCDVEIVGSWQPADAGKVKGEVMVNSKAILTLFVQPRSNDNFSLPTANLNCSMTLDCRAEQCPTMAEVSEMYEKIIGVLDGWHYEPMAFSEDISTDSFYATELMLAGGDKVQFDRQNAIWTLTTNFVIRGTVNHLTTNN